MKVCDINQLANNGRKHAKLITYKYDFLWVKHNV